jgi:hypothetical protein
LSCALLVLACKSSNPPADGATAGTGGATADAAADVAAGGTGGSKEMDASAGVEARSEGPVDTGTGDAATAGACAKDLTGTWELIASRGGPPDTGLLVLDANGFTLTVAGKQLTYVAGQRVVWRGVAGPHTVTVQNTPGAVGAGSLPLAVGGRWVFQGTTERCTMQVGPGAVSGSCQSSARDINAGGHDWPGNVPNPSNGRTYLATRTAPLPSRFGDLGGRWQAKADMDSVAGCQITVEGNDLTFDCHDADFFTGVTRLTIGNDCVASGTSSGGFELGARRR